MTENTGKQPASVLDSCPGLLPVGMPVSPPKYRGTAEGARTCGGRGVAYSLARGTYSSLPAEQKRGGTTRTQNMGARGTYGFFNRETRRHTMALCCCVSKEREKDDKGSVSMTYHVRIRLIIHGRKINARHSEHSRCQMLGAIGLLWHTSFLVCSRWALIHVCEHEERERERERER